MGKSEAVENVNSLARVFQSVIDLSRSLGEVASIEQAMHEASDRAVKARKEADTAQKKLDAIQARAAQEEQGLIAMREAVTAYCAGTKNEADVAAAAAKKTCSTLIREAELKATKKITDAESKAALINEEIAGRSQELLDITARIERARAKMAELLGA